MRSQDFADHIEHIVALDMKIEQALLIVILGMHRSGTSALARALPVLGVDLGERLMGGIPGNNEKGFFEDIDIYAFHNDLLSSMGREWHTLSPLTDEELSGPVAQAFKSRAVEILRSKIGTSSAFGLKDPRISILLPFWQSVFERLPLQVSYVLACRNPLSVARSLTTRDHFDPGKGYHLWLDHMLSCVVFTAGKPRVVIDFDDLIVDPARHLRRIADCAVLQFDPGSTAFREYAAEFLEGRLRHSNFELTDLLLDNEVPAAVVELYRLLKEASSGAASLDDPAMAASIDRLRVRQAEMRPTLRLLRFLDEKAIRLSESIGILEARYEKLSAAMSGGNASFAEMNRILEARNDSLSSTVASRDASIVELNRTISQRNVQLDALQDELNAVRNSRSWRLTRPLRLLRTNLIDSPYHWVRPRLFRERDVGLDEPCGSNQAGLTKDEFVPLLKAPPLQQDAVKLISFYLPQFHAIPENDAWWGEGFTEWTKVRPAKPQFVGHYQPHVPGELGYYNLLEPGVQRRQVELAKLYGIGGFCFYFYWFGGKRLLEAPIEAYRNDSSLDLPFCLCWANENWTRRWDGQDNEILIAQRNSPEDDIAFIEHVARYLRDPRYIRIGGRPLLLVFRPNLLPSVKDTAQRWRNWCVRNGIGDIYLAYTQSFVAADPTKYGFDAAVEFPPNISRPPNITGRVKPLIEKFDGSVYDWRILVKRSEHYKRPAYKLFRGVCTGWDNTPRRGNRGTVFLNSAPDLYQRWLEMAIGDTEQRAASPDERLVFVNAWNEWAEGAHLEPDNRYGYAYLQATRNALMHSLRRSGHDDSILLVSHDCHPHGAQFLLLEMARRLKFIGFKVFILTLDGGRLLDDFRQVGRTFNAKQSGDGREERFLSRLSAQGVRIAITSTTGSGSVVPRLKKLGFRVLSLVHELPGVIQQLHLQAGAKAIASLADKVVFPAEMVQERFPEIMSLAPERVMIRPQGLLRRNPYEHRREEAHRSICEKHGLPLDTRLVLSVAYVDSRKGPDLFVETAVHVLATRPNTVFIWVGHADPAMKEAIDAGLDAQDLQSRVLFVGFDRDPMAYYAAASVYALPSREDPFPNVVLEAAAVGVPVVAFAGATGASDFILAHGGRLARFLDAGDFAKQTCELLDLPMRGAIGNVGSMQQYVLDLLHALDRLPRISVIVPNYNYGRHIAERLDTILRQDFPIYELIVLDDASADDSVQIIKRSLLETDIDVHVVVNETNSGSAFRQWEKGLALCKGDLVWIAEADDLAQRDFLRQLSSSFYDTDVVLAFSQSKQIDESGKEMSPDYLNYTKEISDRWASSYVRDGCAEISDSLSIKNTIPNVSAVLFRRSVLERALLDLGEDLYAYKVAGDWMLYLHVLMQGKVAFNEKPLNSHRRHASSVTHSIQAVRHLQEVRRVQEVARSLTAPPDEITARANAYLEYLAKYLGVPHADAEDTAMQR
jgi:glycosyltransferase involved in cell wall biosynthesis